MLIWLEDRIIERKNTKAIALSGGLSFFVALLHAKSPALAKRFLESLVFEGAVFYKTDNNYEEMTKKYLYYFLGLGLFISNLYIIFTLILVNHSNQFGHYQRLFKNFLMSKLNGEQVRLELKKPNAPNQRTYDR